jgi:hypothetical protein
MKGRNPLPVLEEEGRLVARAVGQRAAGGVARRGGFGQDLLHARVGREGLALLDADRGPDAQRGGVDRVGRLLLHDLVQHRPERFIGRRDHVERLAGTC